MLTWLNLDCDSSIIGVRSSPGAQMKALEAVPNSLIGKLPENQNIWMVKRCKNKINVGDNPPEGVAAPVGEEAGNGEANDHT